MTRKNLLRPIREISVGRRHRKDMGDLDTLAGSIAEIGMLHPIVVRPDGKLVAGERRLKACKILGWDSVPVTIVDIDKIARGEHDENIYRKDFTWTEAVAIKREVDPEEKIAAKERMTKGGRGKKGVKIAQPLKGRAADKAAKATGKKARSLAKAEKVVVAAEKEPEKFAKLAEDMDESGNVDRAFRQLNIMQKREAYEARADKGANLGDLVAMAQAGDKFAAIYADPPWEYKVYSGKGKQRSAERYYDTSSLEAIKALPIASLAADNCVLFLWGVWPELPGALEVIKAWGFEYKTVAFVWVKQNPSGEGIFTGMGYWSRSNTEFCLLAARGAPQRMAEDVHQVIMAPRPGEHSRKPDEVRRRIERLVVGSYLELFARSPSPGWTAWGNELESPAEAAE